MKEERITHRVCGLKGLNSDFFGENYLIWQNGLQTASMACTKIKGRYHSSRIASRHTFSLRLLRGASNFHRCRTSRSCSPRQLMVVPRFLRIFRSTHSGNIFLLPQKHTRCQLTTDNVKLVSIVRSKPSHRVTQQAFTVRLVNTGEQRR